MNRNLLFCFVFLLLNASCYSQEKIELFNKYTSDYQIVIPQKPTQIEKEASRVLQDYLFKITNFSFPIVFDNDLAKETEILIGKTARTNFNEYLSLKNDGTLIRTQSQKLVITGGDRKGVLYAVYTFLEKYLNCRKYTNTFEVIPKQNAIILKSPIDSKQIPDFEFRSTYSEESLDKNFADWHKLNFFFEDRLFFVHSFDYFLPPNKYFESHPEYYALINGKREPTQLCLTNPDVYRILKKNLYHEIVKYPNNRYWSVSQNDNGSYCHCNKCEFLHNSGNGFIESLMPFVNKIAEDFPSKTISTLAYRQSIGPSKLTKPRSNVEIMFCLTNLNRAVPITAAVTNAILFRDFLKDWKRQTNNIFVWDYTVNYSNSLSPFPNLPVLQPNLIFLKENSIRKVYLQGIGNQKGEFSELKNYLISKLLWNCYVDVKAVQKEFINAYYGPAAAPYIEQYVVALQTAVKMGTSNIDIWANPIINKDDFLSEMNISNYNKIFNQAIKKTKLSSLYRARVMKEFLGVKYAEIEIARQDERRLVLIGGKKELEKRINDFTSNIKRIGIEKLMNGERSPDEYRRIVIQSLK